MKFIYACVLIGALFSYPLHANGQIMAPKTSPIPSIVELDAILRKKLTPPPPYPIPINHKGLENTYQVSAQLYRGGQPTKEGYRYLASLGVKTVISLRLEQKPDKEFIESLGMKSIYIPVAPWTQSKDIRDLQRARGSHVPSFGITDRDVAHFLNIFFLQPQEKIFVHCRYGADRTGTMVALYRISIQNWSIEAAIAEMKDKRFGYRAWLFPSLLDYIRQEALRFRNWNPRYRKAQFRPAP